MKEAESVEQRFLRLLSITMSALATACARQIGEPGRAFLFTCFFTLDFMRYPNDFCFAFLLQRFARRPNDPQLVRLAHLALDRWRDGAFIPHADYPFHYEETEQSSRDQVLLTVEADGSRDSG
jgi:hypothetical protein